MQIRFRCRHCKKTLAVKKELAGKKAKCPSCKQPIVIPTPVANPVDVEALAMAALADEPAPQEAAPQSIDFECEWCSEKVSMPLDKAGKREPCPSCKRIVRVPVPENTKEDWRKVKPTGPTLAKDNQREKLEGEWGTSTARGSVSRDAMEEADAIIIPDEPVGVGRWVKRGVVAILVIGTVVAAVYGFNQQQREKDKKKSIETALELLDEAKKSKDPKLQMPVEWASEIERGLGEYYSRKTGKGMLDKAKARFNEAWGRFTTPIPNRPNKLSLDRDLLMIRVAESQIALGGDNDPEKVPWKNMPGQLSPALKKIQLDDLRAKGLRNIAARLKKLNQEATAISLINQMGLPSTEKERDASLVFAQLLAAMVEQNKVEGFAIKVPRPEDVKKGTNHLAARVGYAEGYARQDQYGQAEEIATAPGDPSHVLRACLAVADVAILTDAQDKAKPVLSKAVAIVDARGGVAPNWELLQLVDMLALTGDTEKAKQLATKLDKEQYELWGEYSQFRAELKKLAAASKEAPATLPQQIKNQNTLPRVLAWEEISRHNTRYGYRDTMKSVLEYPDDPRIKAFIYLGFALGEQDRE